MARLGELGESAASLSCTRWVCFLRYLGRREDFRRSLWNVRGGEAAAYREREGRPYPPWCVCDPGGPWLRTWAAGGIGESHLPAGTRADTGSAERDRPRNARKCHSQPVGEALGPQPAVPESEPALGIAPRPGLRPRSRRRLGAAGTGGGRAGVRVLGGTAPLGARVGRSAEPRASPKLARAPRAGMRGAGRGRAGGWVAREREAKGGSSKRVTAGESGKSPRSPWRRADQWQQRKLFMGAGRRHGSRRSLWSGYLMRVPGRGRSERRLQAGGDDEGCWRGPQAEGREPRGWW